VYALRRYSMGAMQRLFLVMVVAAAFTGVVDACDKGACQVCRIVCASM